MLVGVIGAFTTPRPDVFVQLRTKGDSQTQEIWNWDKTDKYQREITLSKDKVGWYDDVDHLFTQ